ncbi:hypothetical protein [Prosthecochloris sp.]|uniref:hypothetical protein n=1 Tax=Prosthecochloris sp. TaxID=290513 RepID=UPI0025FC4847|nr:hypothetical protein [Prosthecochloris sp.]
MFNFFKKKPKYPVLTSGMIEPTDALLTATDAKKAYKSFMVQIGYLDKSDKLEISSYVGYFAEAMKAYENGSKNECNECKKSISDHKKEIKRLENKAKIVKEEWEQEEIKAEIELVKEEIEMYTKDLKKFNAEFEAFKRDKRNFLIEYVNNEIHGEKE